METGGIGASSESLKFLYIQPEGTLWIKLYGLGIVQDNGIVWQAAPDVP